MSPKIFGIGLNKTGTSTLNKCGRILGYTTMGCNRKLLEDVVIKNDFSDVFRYVQDFDLFEDWPWPLIYKQLDMHFPGSKFILTIRENENIWINSLKKHSLSTDPNLHCRKLAYGYNYPHRRDKEHKEFYLTHREDVNNYFKNRQSDFVELCWERGDGWNELCAFLGKDVPNVRFPHQNKKSDRKTPMKKKLINYFYMYINK